MSEWNMIGMESEKMICDLFETIIKKMNVTSGEMMELLKKVEELRKQIHHENTGW